MYLKTHLFGTRPRKKINYHPPVDAWAPFESAVQTAFKKKSNYFVFC
jgi:hypothetical protein